MLRLLLLLFISNCYADCIFSVINNSTSTITMEAGFFNKNKILINLEPSMSSYQVVKSDLNCLDVAPSGVGFSYINLVGGKSSGGWVYDPGSKMLRAVGGYIAPADGRICTVGNGGAVLLLNNVKPQNDVFEVSIKNIKRNVSRQLGSSD